MARKPPVSYATVELEPIATPAMQVVSSPSPDPSEEATTLIRRGRPPANRTLKEASAPVMLYLHPAGAKALKRYALDQNTKVHSLLLDAVEAWFKAHGLREPVRVRTAQDNADHEH
jgi:hypothetical protein